jgi:UPF0755 protein
MKKMKKTKILTKAMAAFEGFLIVIIFILFYLTRDVNTYRVIYVPKGNINYTIKILRKNGLDVDFFDKFFIRLLGYPQAGWIDLKSTKMTKMDFFYRLDTSKAALAKIEIIPGETEYFVYREIGKKLKINDFYCEIPRGFLKPDTYYLPIGMKRKRVCDYLYKIALNWHENVSKKFLGVWNYKLYLNKLIIASIIQKEAGNDKEMPLVSAVIYNRLKKHMKLQMDGSLNYGKYSHIPVSVYRIKHDDTRFNTYKYYGLPPQPVCIPSIEAIIAAFFPAKVNYLYFVKCGRKLVFSSSFSQHKKNIEKCEK